MDDVEESTLSRPVRGAATAGQSTTLTPDDYLTRLLKYVPTEVVALYLTLQGVIRSEKGLQISDASYSLWFFAIVFIGVIATPTYLRALGVRKQLQILLSTLAFLIWAFAIGGDPIESLMKTYEIPTFIPSIVVIIATFFFPLMVPADTRSIK